MIKLEPHQVCPFGSVCEYSEETLGDLTGFSKCQGLNPERNCTFICELWAENYEGRNRYDKRKSSGNN